MDSTSPPTSAESAAAAPAVALAETKPSVAPAARGQPTTTSTMGQAAAASATGQAAAAAALTAPAPAPAEPPPPLPSLPPLSLPTRLWARRQARRRVRATQGHIHFGFWSSYSTVRAKVHAVVAEELLREPGQLYLTGHSLGGALATVCAYDMALWVVPAINARLGRGSGSPGGPSNGQDGCGRSGGFEHNEEIGIVMYNFGSPRVGDAFFQRRYNRLVPESYRVVCDGDFIAGMPPARLGYVHVGRTAVVDKAGSGSLLIDPSLLETSFKTSRNYYLTSHLFDAYTRALDGCLYPSTDSPEEIRELVAEIYRHRGDGKWFGCARFFLTCGGRLFSPRRQCCEGGGIDSSGWSIGCGGSGSDRGLSGRRWCSGCGGGGASSSGGFGSEDDEEAGSGAVVGGGGC
ncbi:unnamed protein product [Phaeothamnion confervicola]